ncbi:hypothetical protein DDW11_03390 [Sulfolobus sp. SCGC AB-777_G06]|nr:hypothetical protein DDW11_03390 [Sulfolobus sp. SCGC AB-777_G06]
MIDERIIKLIEVAEALKIPLKLLGELELDVGSLRIITAESLDVEDVKSLLDVSHKRATIKINKSGVVVIDEDLRKELHLYADNKAILKDIKRLFKIVENQTPSIVIYHGWDLDKLQKVLYFGVRKIEYFEGDGKLIINDLIEVDAWDEKCLTNVMMYIGEVVKPIKIGDCNYYYPILALLIQKGGIFERDFAKFECNEVSPPDLTLLKFMMIKDLRNCYNVLGGDVKRNIDAILTAEEKYTNANLVIQDGKYEWVNEIR